MTSLKAESSMRYLAMSLVVLGLALRQTAALDPSLIEPPTQILLSSSLEGRQLQNTNFRATYLARYQHLADASCAGPAPVIQVFCRGNLAPISISSASIECSYATDPNGWKGLNCINTCVQCENVYLERSSYLGGGTFGQIAFQCVGEVEADVDSYMTYLGGEAGSCEEVTLTTTTGDSRNYHVAQLGVQCPTALGSAFRFSDYHFECGTGSDVGKFRDRYTCTAGANCRGQECQVQYNDIMVHADSHNFYECMEALNEVEVGSAPLIGSLQTESEPGTYTTRFQANWQLKLDTTFCSGEFSTKRITCLNETMIANVEPLFDNVNCTLLNDNVMECNENTKEHFVNSFSGVQYDCVGPTLPETMVEYLGAYSYCDTNTLVDKNVAHLLQLGVVCKVPGTKVTIVDNSDAFFECGPDMNFDILEGIYTCMQVNTFSRNVDDVVVPLEVATMRTDYRWSSERPAICFDYTNATFAPDDTGEDGTETDANTPSPTEGNLDIPVAPGPMVTPQPTPSPTKASPALNVTEDVMVIIPVAPTLPQPNITESAPTTNAPTPSPTPLVVPPGTTYKVDYVARFQQIVSPGCASANPGIVLTCLGQVQGVSSSDASIECGTESITLDDGRDAVLCENTCSGSDCESIFLSENEIGGSAPFGEIYFTCSGETPMATDATFIIIEGSMGTCDASDASGNGYNLNMAQLGVECPQEDGSAYLVDDHHSDCGVRNRAINVDNQYTCFAGQACGSEPCLVDFEQLIVAADPHQFEDCIQSSNGSPIPQLPTPSVPPKDKGIYIATFQANWEFILDNRCVGSVSPTEITCTNGSIRLVESLGTGSVCAVTSQNSIECTGSAASGGVIYECESSSAIPETHVEYASGEARCDVANLIERHLQLGILCGTPGAYVYGDIFLECGPSNSFEIFNGDTFTCLSSLLVSASKQTSSSSRIPEVEIYTDYRWPLFTSELCYKYTPVRRRLADRRIDIAKHAKQFQQAARARPQHLRQR